MALTRGSRSSKQVSSEGRAHISPGQTRLLTQIAALLLADGVTPGRFQALMARAFVQAASHSATLKNGRVSYSRVAARTGLRRAIVRDILQKNAVPRSVPSPLERLVLGWRTDSDFVDRNGTPRQLTVRGKRRSFASLARKYVRDIPYRALIQELVEARLVSLQGDDLRLCRPKRKLGFIASKSFGDSVELLLKHASKNNETSRNKSARRRDR
jgi:hypothetical protein